MFNNKKNKEQVIQPVPYKETKEYLDRQQNIDYLLVLSKLAENPASAEISVIVKSEIPKLIDKLK